jgi:hypothetical protein
MSEYNTTMPAAIYYYGMENGRDFWQLSPTFGNPLGHSTIQKWKFSKSPAEKKQLCTSIQSSKKTENYVSVAL